MSSAPVPAAVAQPEAAPAGTGLTPALRRQLLIACCLVASAQITWGAIVPALPLYGDLFSIPAVLLGAIVSAFGVGRLVMNLPAGLLADRYGPRRLVVGAVLGLVVVTVLTAFAHTLALLLVARFLAGVLGGAVVTIGLAVVTARAPAQARGTVLATAQAVQLAGGALGPVVGGLVLDTWGMRAVFVAAATPALCCLVWTLLSPDPAFWAKAPRRVAGPDALADGPSDGLPGAPPAARLDPRPGPEARLDPRPGALSGGLPSGLPGGLPGADAPPATAPRRRPAMSVDAATFLAINVMGFAVFFIRFGGEQSLVPILGDSLGMSSTMLGASIGVVTLVSLGLLPLLARVLDAGWRRRLLVPGMIVAAAAMALYPLATTPAVFAVALVLAGVGASVAGIVPGVALADVAAPGRQGAAMGVFRTTGDLGAVVGPLVLGLALDHWGASAASLVLAGVALTAALLYAALTTHRPPSSNS